MITSTLWRVNVFQGTEVHSYRKECVRNFSSGKRSHSTLRNYAFFPSPFSFLSTSLWRIPWCHIHKSMSIRPFRTLCVSCFNFAKERLWLGAGQAVDWLDLGQVSTTGAIRKGELGSTGLPDSTTPSTEAMGREEAILKRRLQVRQASINISIRITVL